MLKDHEQYIESGHEHPPVSGTIVTKRAMQVGRRPAVGYNQGDGLKEAYGTPEGMQLHGNTFYIAGTRPNQDDIEDDIKLILPGQGVRSTTKYQKAAAFIRAHRSSVHLIVGHSLGAAVADALSQDFKIPEMAYGDPMPTYVMGKGHHRNWGDLVSIADFRTRMDTPTSWDFHDYYGEASKYGNDEYDNQ
jgi:hypothetical protein